MLPWGLVGALVLLGSAELGLRLSQSEGVVAYEMKAPAYRSIPYELDRTGAAPVSVLGSSRAREGVSMPTMSRAIEDATGQSIGVANYALAGGRGEEVRFLASLLATASPRPGLVLYGVGPRQLLPNAEPYQKFSHMWRLSDWFRFRVERGAEVDPYFGRAARNSLGRVSFLVRYEPQVREALLSRKARWKKLRRALTEVRDRDKSPILGHATVWHQRKPKRSTRVSSKRARKYLNQVTAGQPYRLYPQQVECVDETIRTLRAAGIDVVLFEVPMSPALREVFPAEVEAEFHELMDSLAAKNSVPYLRLAELGVALKRKHFREQSHANRLGADRVSLALADQVVVPWLAGEERASPQ